MQPATISILLTLAIAYLLGSVPFGYLLVLAFRRQDVRAIGSGNIGATNVARAGGRWLGIATLVLDCSKGVAAVLIARAVAPHYFAPGDLQLPVAAAVAAVVGHVFPVWLRFRGGKGIATALGVFLALVPAVALASLLLFSLVLAITRYVSLGSILAAISIPLFTLALVHPHPAVLLAGVSTISAISILKHHANIGRLLRGTEPRMGSGRNSA